jgi:hypothetical protein
MIRLPAAPLAAAAVAFGAGFWIAWTIQAATLADTRAAYEAREAQYQTRLAESLAQAQAERERLQAQLQGALNERDAEIIRLGDLARRVPDTIRVRVPATCPVPAGADSEARPAGVPGSEAGGVLHPEPAGLDIRRLRQLVREADELNASYRALLKACS